MKRSIILLAAICILPAYAQKADTVEFRPEAGFQWKVNLRHDYAHTLVDKLGLCNACFDGKVRMRDNGKKDMAMNLDEALEAIKAMDAITLGMPKIIYLVGWQYNGHDSKYPAMFEGNTSLTRPGDKDPLESIRWLMREAKKYNTSVSFHINLTDCYDDSPLFQEYVEKDVIARDKQGRFMESCWGWGYKLSYVEEFNKGLLQKRVDSLCSILPLDEVGTIHVDAFIDHVPQYITDENGESRYVKVMPMDQYHGHTIEEEAQAQRDIVKYFDAKGVDVTTEWFSENFPGYIPMVYHYYDKSLYTRFTAGQISGGDDKSEYGELFGTNNPAERYFGQRTKTIAQRADDFKDGFCMGALKRDYLNCFDRIRLIVHGNGDKEAFFSDGVRTAWIDSTAYLWKNGALLAEGTDLFIPANWVDGRNIIAFSLEGYEERQWTLPDGFSGCRKASVYEVTQTGETELGTITVKKGTVTLSVKPHQMLRLKFR